jgi:aryl-alcohol dehydrogenase-like predicted oxidoreductase
MNASIIKIFRGLFMKYSTLGSSGLKVSRVCLGSMTWGVQNNQSDADAQIKYALDKGINFIDTAEMYAIPPTADTYGSTETIIGDWLSRHSSQRKDIILASKIAGVGLPWIRGGQKVDGASVIKAVDDSLARLQTDYIDLYQIHWPNRTSPHFGKHWHNQVKATEFARAQQTEEILDILEGVQKCIDAGKIRHLGLSDDTPWGISEYLKLSDKHELPRIASIQNEFNLLHSKDWPYLIEQCVLENVAFLSWSPLAGGVLSGKYIDGHRPEGSRWSIAQRNGLFRDNESVNSAVKTYKAVAEKYNMSAAQLALLWCDNIDGVTSSIIGATNVGQLAENIDAFDLEFTDELEADILEVLKSYPMPF